MKVFISWSGGLSNLVALALREWLPLVVQAAEPWMSGADLNAGGRWQTEIAGQLAKCNFGILCLTRDNLSAPWILFEAGALSKQLNASAVCPYLIDVASPTLCAPLDQFNATSASREGTRALVAAINRALGDRSLPSERLNQSFDAWWPTLDEKLAAAIASAGSRLQPESVDGPAGVQLYANDIRHFEEVARRDFASFVQDLLTKSPAGTQFRIMGIDWTELFGEGVSGISELYLSHFRHRALGLRVILVDPRTAIPLVKRFSENQFIVGDDLRYQPNRPTRIYEKILGSCATLENYHRLFPDQIEYRFVQEVPSLGCILGGSVAVLCLYSRCHKAWDSPILVVASSGTGILSFVSEYFEFMWLNREVSLPRNSDAILDRFRQRLESLRDE